MSDAAQQEEPSIEEILGSIRRIISEDDEPEEEVVEETPEEVVEQAAAPEPKPEPTPQPPKPDVIQSPVEEDDVLELTQMIDDDGSVADNEEEPVAPEEVKIDMLDDKQPVVEDLPPLAEEENLVSEGAADVTAAVMAKLARSAAVTHKSDGISIEDVVRELVKPMLRQWLDDNLPDIVEQMVERELERIARRAKD